MERKIGEIFEYNGEWYQCVEQPDYIGDVCKVCSFSGIGNCELDRCSGTYRSDKKSVIFKKLEKVGEPYEYFIQGMGIIMVQEYILANPSYICDDDKHVVIMYCQNGKIAIEIKQNKEDMEEKKQKIDDLVGLYSSAKITYKEFDKELKALYNKQENKPAPKPFNLESVKAGKLVCTRDGRKARIICFDVKGDICPVIALVEENNMEVIYRYDENGQNAYSKSELDLMMLPKKKEGWVNIDKGGSGKITISSPYSTKKEAIHNDNETTIDTIKICWGE